MVAVFVGEVARADFGSHIPTVEWGAWELLLVSGKEKIGEYRQGIPAEA